MEPWVSSAETRWLISSCIILELKSDCQSEPLLFSQPTSAVLSWMRNTCSYFSARSISVACLIQHGELNSGACLICMKYWMDDQGLLQFSQGFLWSWGSADCRLQILHTFLGIELVCLPDVSHSSRKHTWIVCHTSWVRVRGQDSNPWIESTGWTWLMSPDEPGPWARTRLMNLWIESNSRVDSIRLPH